MNLLQGKRRIFVASDFDGTLCPTVEHPDQARVDAAMRSVLEELRQSPHVTFAVISGRSLDDLRHHLPCADVLAGNDGLEVLYQDAHFEHSSTSALRTWIRTASSSLAALAEAWSGAWVEVKPLSMTLHFRRVRLGQAELVAQAVRSLNGIGTDFQIREGNSTLEVTPAVHWNTGAAMRWLRRKLGPFDATVCLGGRTTDTALFAANRGSINIFVGETAHPYITHPVGTPAAAAALLRELIRN